MRWPDSTIMEGIRDVSQAHPDAPAVVVGDRETTYRELVRRAETLAGGLASAGVATGDTVAVWLPNGVKWITCQLAASHLGATVVAVNTRSRQGELEHLLTDAECTALVTTDEFLGIDYLGMVADLIPAIETDGPLDTASFPSLGAVVSVEGGESYPGVLPYGELLDRGRARSVPPAADDPSAPVCVFYTSGTTGEPKGCLQSNRSLLNHSYNVGVHLGVESTDTALGILPFCGVMGYNMFLSALAHGTTLVTAPRFKAERALDDIETHGVTYCSGLFTMFERMRESPEFDPERVASLRRGAVVFINGFDAEQFDRIEAAFDFPVVQPYGLSEANSQVFVGDPDADVAQRKRVGGPLVAPESQDAKIVDPETGEPRAPGEPGRLLLRGYNVMNGYLGRPDAMAEAFDDEGWFRTSDVCVADEEGRLYYRSRIDDALRIKGFLVAPAEIESELLALDSVTRAQVVGVSRAGETVPVAFVQSADRDESAVAAAVERGLDGRLAPYKRPERVVVVDSFPHTEGPHGKKVQKHALEERARLLFDETDADTDE